MSKIVQKKINPIKSKIKLKMKTKNENKKTKFGF